MHNNGTFTNGTNFEALNLGGLNQVSSARSRNGNGIFRLSSNTPLKGDYNSRHSKKLSQEQMREIVSRKPEFKQKQQEVTQMQQERETENSVTNSENQESGSGFIFVLSRRRGCNDENVDAMKRSRGDVPVYRNAEDAIKCAPKGKKVLHTPCSHFRSTAPCNLMAVGENEDPCAQKVLTAVKDASFPWYNPVFENRADLEKCAPFYTDVETQDRQWKKEAGKAVEPSKRAGQRNGK